MTGSYGASLLIFLGLFLIGGAYSMFKQGASKGLAVCLVVCAAMAIGAGAMRW